MKNLSPYLARDLKNATGKYVVLNFELINRENGSVHRNGCKAIADDDRIHGAHLSGDFDTWDEMYAHIDEDIDDLGYDATDMKIHGCAKQLHKEELVQEVDDMVDDGHFVIRKESNEWTVRNSSGDLFYNGERGTADFAIRSCMKVCAVPGYYVNRNGNSHKVTA